MSFAYGIWHTKRLFVVVKQSRSRMFASYLTKKKLFTRPQKCHSPCGYTSLGQPLHSAAAAAGISVDSAVHSNGALTMIGPNLPLMFCLPDERP